jgi:hypothetical protein
MRSPQSLGEYVVSVDACSSENSGAPSLITAAGTGDATKVTGQTIDRYQSGGFAKSIVVQTSYLAALTAAKDLELAHELQESDDGSSWDTAEVIEATTVKATGAGNKRGVDEHAVDCTNRKRYIRFNVTPDLTASGTDTATFHTVATLGGFDQLPQ